MSRHESNEPLVKTGPGGDYTRAIHEKDLRRKQPVEDGGAAFPKPASPAGGVGHSQDGMSLRDHFAGLAMQAMVSRHFESHQRLPEAKPGGTITTTHFLPDEQVCSDDSGNEQVGVMDEAISRSAYRIADAMLAARKAGGAA